MKFVEFKMPTKIVHECFPEIIRWTYLYKKTLPSTKQLDYISSIQTIIEPIKREVANCFTGELKNETNAF